MPQEHREHWLKMRREGTLDKAKNYGGQYDTMTRKSNTMSKAELNHATTQVTDNTTKTPNIIDLTISDPENELYGSGNVWKTTKRHNLLRTICTPVKCSTIKRNGTIRKTKSTYLSLIHI